MKQTILAVDLGTSRIRTGLFDSSGACQAVSAFEYPIESSENGAAEQDPMQWAEGLRKTVHEVLAGCPGSQIEGVSFSGQMHGTVLVGEDGRPLCPAIIWCDQRGGEAVRWIRDEIGSERYESITGNPLASGFQAATLGWLKSKNPDLLLKANRVLLPKDFLVRLLTGQSVTEPTDAVSTGLLDIDLPDGNKPHWSEAIVELLGMKMEQFPVLCSSLLPEGLVVSQEGSEIGRAHV